MTSWSLSRAARTSGRTVAARSILPSSSMSLGSCRHLTRGSLFFPRISCARLCHAASILYATMSVIPADFLQPAAISYILVAGSQRTATRTRFPLRYRVGARLGCRFVGCQTTWAGIVPPVVRAVALGSGLAEFVEVPARNQAQRTHRKRRPPEEREPILFVVLSASLNRPCKGIPHSPGYCSATGSSRHVGRLFAVAVSLGMHVPRGITRGAC